MESLRLLVRLFRPVNIIFSLLMYALGAGISRYLGVSTDWIIYWQGLLIVILIHLGAQCLMEFFNWSRSLENPSKTYVYDDESALGSGKLPGSIALSISLACLATGTYISWFLLQQNLISGQALFIFLGALLGVVLYSTPPVRLAASGYGALIVVLLITILIPAFAFLLQANHFHRLLAMSTFPLAALHLAMLICLDFPAYAKNIKKPHQNLTTRIGWQYSMLLHNLLILIAFFLLGLAITLGMPLWIGLPVFLLLPLGLLQIWNMKRIADGYKPNWSALTTGAVALYLIAGYLLGFSYWIR